MIAGTPRPFLTMPKPVVALPVLDKDRSMLVDGVLARPLFAATRRPIAALAASAPLPASLPRLAGILVNGHSRSAIFAVAGEGRPLVVQEGAQVGGHTVQSIKAGQVTLSGSGAPQVLRPTFDPRPQSATAAQPRQGWRPRMRRRSQRRSTSCNRCAACQAPLAWLPDETRRVAAYQAARPRNAGHADALVAGVGAMLRVCAALWLDASWAYRAAPSFSGRPMALQDQ